MAATHLAYPHLAIDHFSSTDPDQYPEPSIQLIERKINFAFESAPGNTDELANYTFSKKAPFPFLLRGPTVDWYVKNFTNATTWENAPTNFIIRFSDGQNKFRYKMEVENCTRKDGEEFRNFLHCTKRTVGKGWLNDINGFEAAQQNAERDTQAQQRRQRYMN